MNIIEVLDKEVLDYWNVKEEDIFDRFELNGEVYFEKGEIDNGYDFYLGKHLMVIVYLSVLMLKINQLI